MTHGSDRGYAMAALLVALSVMSIMLGVALPVWRTSVQRERETELVFRGEQYMQAISLFSRRTGGFPTSFDMLRTGRYIRKLYKDPITNGDFQPVYLGQVATVPTAPSSGAPGQVGQVGQGSPAGLGLRGQPMGPTGQPTAGGRGAQAGTPAGGRAGQPSAATPGQPGALGAGPIIGVVSRSTGEALRLYNGRGHYNEWLFVSVAATQQPGAPGGGRGPGVAGRGGRAGGPDGRGRDGQAGGVEGRGRGGRGRGEFPPGRGTPFGRPGGFPPPGGFQMPTGPNPR